MLTVKNLLTNNMLKVTYLFLVIIIKYNIQKHFEKTKTFYKKNWSFSRTTSLSFGASINDAGQEAK
jgi:hypothetical protein